MARSVVVMLTATGTTSAVPLDPHLDPFNIGLAVTSTATAGAAFNATVQISFDDPWGTYTTDYNTNAVWMNHSTLNAVTATGNQNGNIAFPVRAVRMTATTFSATGGASGGTSVSMTVIQAGIANY